MLRIKEVAKEKGYTVTNLADKLEMSQVSLSRIINGNPTAETLLKIANALDVDVRELFVPTKEDDQETIYIQTKEGLKPIGEIKKGSI